MKRAACPEGQIDIFCPETMAKLFSHPSPAAPLPALPFERNKEIDVARACRILSTNLRTIQRMCKDKLIRSYKIKGGTKGRPTYRIEHASIVEYCDKLRMTYHIAPRKASPGRPPDEAILPFPARETISTQDVMDHLGVSQGTVRKLFDPGELIAYQLIVESNSPWRIWRPSFVRYIESLRRDAS
jgi:hypothetical protein